MLKRRAQLLWSVRQFFHSRGLAEVNTPILSHDTVIDRHIDPIPVPGSLVSLPAEVDSTFYLQTSPEFGMKRLLAAGMPAIYQVAHVFRAAERGAFHNPEFTMIEWYRVSDDLLGGIDLLSDLIRAVLNVELIDLSSYQSVFRQYVACDPLTATVSDLAHAAVSHQLSVETWWSEDRDDWLNLLFAEVIQPQLGRKHPIIVTHYPASQSALAQISAEDNRTAERFELFIGGLEVANGYHELLDARELQARNRIVLDQRTRDGKQPLPIESRLLAAMRAGLPGCSGCALGFDRLVMIATGANSIDEVIAFPIERA